MKDKAIDMGVNTRAYPRSDANILNARNARASPLSDGKIDKNQCSQTTHKIRMATWNLGTLTGRSQELAEILKRRSINICCVQETHWKGAKSRDLGRGYQLVYYGTDNKHNGVGVILDSQFRDRIVNIERKTDRILAVKLALDNQPILNIVCVYAPQAGCPEAEKESFWEDLDELVINIPSEEIKFVLGDLNGHVGKYNNVCRHIHGGYGFGIENKEGKCIIDFCSRHTLSIINTNFQKNPEHLITYKSGGKSSQIDFILADDKSRGRFKDCKVIPGESLTAQHRILVGVYNLPKPVRKIMDRTSRIKWKELTGPKGESLLEDLRKYLENDMKTSHATADDIWINFERECSNKASKKLGISKGGISTGKDPTWWQEEVKDAVRNKKLTFKTWQSTARESDRIIYTDAKTAAKKAVAQARANARESLYRNIEKATSEAEIFRLAKNKHRSTQDIKRNKYIKSKTQKLLTMNDDINNRWYEYYKELMNEEFPSQPMDPLPPIEGPVNKIEVDEVQTAVNKMKNHKAVGPDEIPAELWKRLGQSGAAWLTRLFNIILTTRRMPEAWRLSYLIPFYKNKGDVTQCGNYRGIKLTSHSFKIWEHVINRRIQQLSSITPNQFGFTPSKSTTEAIQAVRIITEKYRLNKEDLHLIFIDLEKAFDRVSRKVVWQSLRAQHLPECYINLIQDMYSNVRTKVRSPAGLSQEFEVRVGVHQGSALSPLLFNLVMDMITKNIQEPLPWNLLYADDIVLIAKTPNELQNTLSLWINTLENAGLRVSRSKTEHLECSFSQNSKNMATIYYPDHTPVPKVTEFKYLGSVISNSAGMEADVAHRVSVAWQKWRSLTGVLCDPKMPIRTKGKVYKMAVRPAMLYGAECWTVKDTHVQRLHTTEMKMLRWSGGVTRLDRIRNEYIRGSFKVAPVPEKLLERRLRWFGHVMRRNENHVVRKAMCLSEHKRGRGRPPSTWWTSMRKTMVKNNVPDPTTQDRTAWRRHIRRADPT